MSPMSILQRPCLHPPPPPPPARACGRAPPGCPASQNANYGFAESTIRSATSTSEVVFIQGLALRSCALYPCACPRTQSCLPSQLHIACRVPHTEHYPRSDNLRGQINALSANLQYGQHTVYRPCCCSAQPLPLRFPTY